MAPPARHPSGLPGKSDSLADVTREKGDFLGHSPNLRRFLRLTGQGTRCSIGGGSQLSNKRPCGWNGMDYHPHSTAKWSGIIAEQKALISSI